MDYDYDTRHFGEAGERAPTTTPNTYWNDLDRFEYDVILESAMDSAIVQHDYITTVSYILVSIAVFVTAVLVSYVIFKFKRLHTRTNYIFLNFFILSALFALVFLTKAITSLLGDGSWALDLELIQQSTLGVLISLNIILAFDWYSSANWYHIFIKYSKYYKWIMCLLHVPLILAFSSLLLRSVVKKLKLLESVDIFKDVLYIIGLIVLVIWHILRSSRTYTSESLKTYYSFSSATVYILLWLPLFLSETLEFPYLSEIENSLNLKFLVAYAIVHISCLVGLSSPVLIAYLLTRWDRQFKMAFEHVFTRKHEGSDGGLSYTNYISSENLEDEEASNVPV